MYGATVVDVLLRDKEGGTLREKRMRNNLYLRTSLDNSENPTTQFQEKWDGRILSLAEFLSNLEDVPQNSNAGKLALCMCFQVNIEIFLIAKS